MLNKIIEFSINQKLIIGLFVLALIGYGSFQITQLPIDAVPDITDNQVQVITVTPSLGAPDVERLITFPIEKANSNNPGLREIRSFSRFGLSLITIVFEDDVDVYWARQQVTERLSLVKSQIPKGIGEPELAPVTTGLGEIYQYVLKPKKGFEAKYNATELRTIQDWIVKRQLISVKGVADVSSFGGRVKQYEIAINPNILKSYSVTVNDVFTALEKNNENTGGAYIEKQSTVLYIRAEGLINTIEDIKNIVVKSTNNGTPILINDVAEVRIGNAIRYGAITYNDEGEVAGGVVMMLKGDNSSRVIKEVKEKIIQIKKTLPEGVELEPFLDRTKMVNNAISTVASNLLEGALIVIFVLVLFLGNLRAGLIVASVIPLAMLFAVIMMNIFGVSGNLMSLGALDFGLIVDGAVIIVEACMFQVYQTNQQKISQNKMDGIVYNTATRMRNAAVFGELIILVVYLPIFTLQGIEGKMFKPMAQTVAFALLGAFVLSLTYVPMMSALFLSKTKSTKKNISDKMMEVLENIHHRYLISALKYPKLIIVTVLVLFGFALFIFSTLGGEFIPSLPEGDFAVETRVLTGSNITTSSDACLKSARILKRFPEVEKVIGKTGSGEIPTDPMPMEASDLMIILKDKSTWTTANTWDGLAEKMGEALKDVPGVTYSFQFPVAMRFNELMTGAKQDVVCKIFGENLDTLSKYATRLGGIATKVKGTQDIYVEPITGLPQLIINYKRDLIAQYGLNIQDINKVVNTAFAGQSSGLIYEDEKRFDLVVRLAGKQRQELQDVQNLLIPTPQGTQIPLNLVADVSIKESVNQIQRDDAKRRITIGFNVKGRDVQSIVNDLQKQIDLQIKLPTGYYITYGGAFKNLVAAQKRLSIAVPVSLFLIFILLYFAFRSVKQGLLIYSAIPLSAIGGILLLASRGMPFSISAGIGFIALFGVAVLNGIVLIAEFNHIREEGETDLTQIVLKGTKHRLRPVLMTAFVASLGFLPMALSNSAGAEVQRPLATVVIGGLLIATFLTLFVLPILYILFEKNGAIKPNLSKVVTVIILILCVNFGSVTAQTPITLTDALDIALKNNQLLKNQKLRADYQQLLTKTAKIIAPTNVTSEFGQINSAYMDVKVGFVQTISFPKVYATQRNLLAENYKSSVLNVGVRESILKKQVSEVYYELLYLQEKKKLLQKNDSLFVQFLSRATQRLKQGESNILEKTTAENLKDQISLQLIQLQYDLDLSQLRFQLLLNITTVFVPIESQLLINFTPNTDVSFLQNYSTILFLRQQQQIAEATTQVEKSKLQPNLILGYNIMSMRGVGANNMEYNSVPSFQSVQIGLGIPIFSKGQKVVIGASQLNEMVTKNEYEIGLRNIENTYQLALLQYQKNAETISYFQTKTLKNTAIITKTANEQFINGDINYLDWVMLMNQVITIQNQYLEAIKTQNETIINLKDLSSK